MKRGISLIAVLMFMLAATTASVVIFKWIGSENFASGARLKASEAYQASESGIDYVRSWMESKASDVGALVTQYYEKPLVPVKIFENVEIGGDKGQKFSAYMIGIDATANPVLKLKILVEGKARDSSKVFQTAIISTDGLYQVFMPDEPEKPPPSKVKLNDYFGGSMHFMGEKIFSSATVNGNWTGNPPKVRGDFIVTGDMIVSGSGLEIGGNACIGGNYSPNNDNVKITGDLYIGGNSVIMNLNDPYNYCLSTAGFAGKSNPVSYQNVYCEGDMQFGEAGSGEMINGSLTLNGRMFGFNGSRRYRVNGDLVLGDTASIDFGNYNRCEGNTYNSVAPSGTFVACGNVWTNNKAGVRASQTQGEKIKFNYGKNSEEGCPSKSSAALFFKDAARTSPTGEEYKTQPSNPLGYFRSKSTINTTPDPSKNKPVGADSIKKYCMNIFGQPTTGCDGSRYKVGDPIGNALDSIEKFLTRVAGESTDMFGTFKCLNNNVNNVGNLGSFGGSNLPTVLNGCYNLLKNKPKLLYGGTDGYFIIKLHQNELYGFSNVNSTALDGKFILIYEQAENRLQLLPTTQTSKVMMFLKKGVLETGGGQGEMHSFGCQGSYIYPYFIYSFDRIDKINAFTEACPLKGNIFFPSSVCDGRVKNVDNNFSLESNESLVDDLMEMGIICDRSAGPDCKNNSSSSASGSSASTATNQNPGTQDNHWIPIASRLPIKLESKEIRKETIQGTPTEIKSTILVMPRVIRLAPGQVASESGLRNFYEYLYLNPTATPLTTPPTPTCACIGTCDTGGISAKGKYKCTFGSRTDISPFYVIVKKIGN